MITHYDPAKDAEIAYVDDPAGVDFPCHDLTDQQLWQFANGADKVIVRIAEAKTGTIANEIRLLANTVRSMVYARQQPGPGINGFNTPSWQELSILRRDVLTSLNRRTLVGVQEDPENGDAVMALCFVPSHVHGCLLTTRI